MTRWPVVHHLTGRGLGRGFEPRRFGCCLGETGRHIGRMLAHNLSTTLTTDGGLHLRRSHELSRRSPPISSCGATAVSIGACIADRMDRVQNGESRRRSCLLAACSGIGTGGWRSRSRGLHPGGQSSLYSGISTGLACSWPAAMDLLNAADSLQPRSLAVRVRMLARRAEEHAVRGRERESREDLEHAERLRAAPVACVDDRLGHWGSIRLDGYRGSCAILLGCGSEVVHLLEGALRGVPSALDRSLLLADLGAAHAQAGAVDAASESLIESVSLAAEAHAFEFVQRAVGVRQRQLARWSHEPAVRQLDEVLAEAR